MPQADLFTQSQEVVDAGKATEPVAELPSQLTAESKFSAATALYHAYMRGEGFSENTIKSFMSDVRLLDRYLKEQGENPSLGEIGVEDLNRYLFWLRFEREDEDGNQIPCSPKSYARRITTLKSLFGWLHTSGVLPSDPSAPVIQESVQAPLPTILYDNEIERLLRATRDLLWSPTKPDPRPYLLIQLIIQTGIKKNEAMNIRLADIDSSNPREPVLYVRYKEGRYAHKERKLLLGPAFTPVLTQYLRTYRPTEHLFECTARNLEYVLSDAAALAEIPGGVSFEGLRWTSAVRSYRFGTPPEALRQKLGLSNITWRETFDKIKKLASPGM